jgi:hypothetical protein
MPRTATLMATYQFLYDFALHGGTVGSKVFGGRAIPGTAIVNDVALIVDTPFAGGTPTDTLGITLESAGDIAAPSARNAAPWSTGGGKRGTTTAITAPIQLTADRLPQLVIAGSAITAGRCRVMIEFLDPM